MPPTGHYAYMVKEGEEEIIKVPMNEWARYRKSGYAFSDELKYNEQQAAKPTPSQKDNTPTASKKKKKVMRRH